ncbi:DUF5685 family protein [Nonomuraea sp. NPDC050790]|uniref:DUF5685 family protein n=1 Tax=Nonomuraea sp. NPDC050790 TaxID=3364371 RepID=UPI0037B3B984
MFGIVRPCRHGMCGGMFKDWLGHLCGLCLALRDEHGQAARLATNYDALLVSVLAEAQTATPARRRTAGPCALRGFRTAGVVTSEGARLAASVSLILAGAKLRDHVADGDGPYRRRLVAASAGRLAGRWSGAGVATAAALSFDPAPLTGAAVAQMELERSGGRPLASLTTPTEDAVAAAFAHTAVLAGRPGNREPLERAGRAFGRLAHLLDAVEDLAEDRERGAYNPLAATGTTRAAARAHCEQAHAELRECVDGLDLPRPRLATTLLVRETSRAITRTFAAPAEPPSSSEAPSRREAPSSPEPPPDKRPRKPNPGGLISLACAAFSCCTCGLYQPPWEEHDSRCSNCANCGDVCCSGCDCCSDCDCCSGCDCCSA